MDSEFKSAKAVMVPFYLPITFSMWGFRGDGEEGSTRRRRLVLRVERPGALLGCSVGGARAIAQSGGFYGGWITAELAGPFKGDTGSNGWQRNSPPQAYESFSKSNTLLQPLGQIPDHA
jgi:hypothetical protein